MNITDVDRENIKLLMDIPNNVELKMGNAVVSTDYMRHLKSKMLLANVIYYVENLPEVFGPVAIHFDGNYFYYNNNYLSYSSGNSLYKFQHFWKESI